MVKVKYGSITFSLTDDVMNTMIEDNTKPDKPQAVFLNNLAICSMAERGQEFCKVFAPQQPDKMLPLNSNVFRMKAKFFTDETIIIIQNGMSVKVNYTMIKNYYNDILCNIIVKENMEDALDFYNKEKKNG